MTFDFNQYVGAVTRSVTAHERHGRTVRDVTLERSYNTTTDDLWDAITNPARLPRWFLPVSGDLKLGGRYQFEGNAGGTITACEPPSFVAVTWEFGGGMSWVEVRLAPEGDSVSRLTLTHTCPVDEHWENYGPGGVGTGWDLGLVGLAAHLSTGADLSGFDEEAFSTSPEGRAFIVGANEGWRRAAVEAGEDPGKAEAAARRTTAFYTGEELQEG